MSLGLQTSGAVLLAAGCQGSTKGHTRRLGSPRNIPGKEESICTLEMPSTCSLVNQKVCMHFWTLLTSTKDNNEGKMTAAGILARAHRARSWVSLQKCTEVPDLQILRDNRDSNTNNTLDDFCVIYLFIYLYARFFHLSPTQPTSFLFPVLSSGSCFLQFTLK